MTPEELTMLNRSVACQAEHHERRSNALFSLPDPPDAPEPEDPPVITRDEAENALDGLAEFLEGEHVDNVPLVALHMPCLWVDTLSLYIRQMGDVPVAAFERWYAQTPAPHGGYDGMREDIDAIEHWLLSKVNP